MNLVILASSIVRTHLHFKIEYTKHNLFLIILFIDQSSVVEMEGSFATELNEKQTFVLLHFGFCILSMGKV